MTLIYLIKDWRYDDEDKKEIDWHRGDVSIILISTIIT